MTSHECVNVPDSQQRMLSFTKKILSRAQALTRDDQNFGYRTFQRLELIIQSHSTSYPTIASQFAYLAASSTRILHSNSASAAASHNPGSL